MSFKLDIVNMWPGDEITVNICDSRGNRFRRLLLVADKEGDINVVRF